MDAHPVPQNVTDFEFHLVGDMTIKQFGYLAAGIVVAWIMFMMFNKVFPLILYPVFLIPAGLGAAFAFIPIQDRPLDHWVNAFFKAISKPTKRTFQSPVLQKEDPLFKERLNVYFNLRRKQQIEEARTLPPILQKQKNTVFGIDLTQKPQTIATMVPTQPGTTTVGAVGPTVQPILQSTAPVMAPQPSFQPLPAVTPAQPIQNTLAPQRPLPPPAVKVQPEPLPSEEDLKKTIDLAKQAQLIQAQIVKTEQQLNQIKIAASTPGTDTKKFVEQFQELLGQLQKLNQQASDIAARTPAGVKTMPKPATQPGKQTPPAQPTPSPIKPKSIPTVTLTTIPNVVNGIVTDSQGGYIDGAIIVAHDKQGLPVRALKTNKLGQFIAATPLLNGTYTITVEKDSLLFDSVEVELKGEVLQPTIISAKRIEGGPQPA